MWCRRLSGTASPLACVAVYGSHRAQLVKLLFRRSDHDLDLPIRGTGLVEGVRQQ